jgi:hypothetical protein
MANLHFRGYTIDQELNAIIKFRKDTPSNILKTRVWLSKQRDYDSSFKVFGNTFIAYNPRNNLYQELSSKFWMVYSRELLTIRDQPLTNYFISTLPRSQKPVSFPNLALFLAVGKLGFRGHQYSR